MSVWLPELSVALGGVQDTIPVTEPMLVGAVWLPGQPLKVGFVRSNLNKHDEKVWEESS